MRLASLIVGAGLVLAPPAHAQLGFAFGLGGGLTQSSKDADDHSGAAHYLGFAELRLPVVPVGGRVDMLRYKSPFTGDWETTRMLSGVFALPLPVVRPYALFGIAQYDEGVGGENSNGFTYGVGARLGSGLIAPWIEWRAHPELDRRVLTAGVALQPLRF
jgi:hypothetical protein